jgi:murein DD-endopeptidase MepM/ murein hydrolase activator NlpD
MVAVVAGNRVVGCLDASVGQGGFNRPDDVGVVQQLLKNRGHYLESRIDKVCGIFTIQAIKQFQGKYVMHNPDGLIQPGKQTWEKLVSYHLFPRIGTPTNPTALVLVPVAPAQVARTLPAGIRWPLSSNHIRGGVVNNTFGASVRRRSNGDPKAHQGWDFQASIGTPCYAIGDDKVVHVVKNRPDTYDSQVPFGNIVVIELSSSHLSAHPRLYATYAHLKHGSISLSVGDLINIGQVIGQTGKSGNAGSLPDRDHHLHFEIRTEVLPGMGIGGRISPMEIFGPPPLHNTIASPLD